MQSAAEAGGPLQEGSALEWHRWQYSLTIYAAGLRASFARLRTGGKIRDGRKRRRRQQPARFTRSTGPEAYRTHFKAATLGWSQENAKSVIEGNNVVRSPINGPRPNPSNFTQKSNPSSPGFVFVI